MQQTRRPSPSPDPTKTILDFFDSNVMRDRTAPFLLYFDQVVSYGQSDEQSDALATSLRSRGIEAGDRIGIYLQNTPAWCIIAIAAWKLGCVVVPINPMYRMPEVLKIVDDAGTRCIVAHPELLDEMTTTALSEHGVISILSSDPWNVDAAAAGLLSEQHCSFPSGVEDLVDLVEADTEGFERAPIGGTSLAVLTYTSGTTGPPKGSMSSHAALAFNTATYQDWMNLTRDDVVLGVAPLFHITGLVGAFLIACLLGAPLVLTYRFDPEMVFRAVEEHKATFTIASITAFTALMHSPASSQANLTSLRTIYSGGAPIMPSTLQGFHDRFGIYIHNIYGLTETNSPTHAVPLNTEAPVDPETGAISVGICVYETSAQVVDEQGAPLANGEIGEICVRGPQLFSGYWNKPEATAVAMSEGWFFTGDVGYINNEGWCFIIDRKKDQINVSGYKVWPREVEDVLTNHPMVREAAVIGVPDEYRGESVKAFVSLSPGSHISEDELIQFCRSAMAAYKYPRSIEIVEEIPKTATGKILRRELRLSTKQSNE